MRDRHGPERRGGGLMVEAAIVYPVWFLLLFGLTVGGLGVFRYQEVAWLCREVARLASVRGSDYQKETGKQSPTEQELKDQVVLAMGVGFQADPLKVEVQIIDGVSGVVSAWDSSAKAPSSTTATGVRVSNSVQVTVDYEWFPEVILAGPIRLKSVSVMPMSF